jgi:transposase-like protein
MKRRVSRNQGLEKVLERRYWRTEDAQRVLGAWRRSNLSMAAFAREHGLVRARLARWQRRLRTRRSDSQAVAFHPVRVVMPSEGRSKSESAIELVLAGGRRVVVGRGFDAVVLEELVRVVESWPC